MTASRWGRWTTIAAFVLGIAAGVAGIGGARPSGGALAKPIDPVGPCDIHRYILPCTTVTDGDPPTLPPIEFGVTNPLRTSTLNYSLDLCACLETNMCLSGCSMPGATLLRDGAFVTALALGTGSIPCLPPGNYSVVLYSTVLDYSWESCQ